MRARDRVTELRRVRAADLLPSPLNWRVHPPEQRAALSAILAEVGIADALIARENGDGRLVLIDGHLRAETLPDQEVPVLVVDLDDHEALKVLATLDPLAAMASPDEERLRELLESVAFDDHRLTDLVRELVSFEATVNGGNTDPDAVPEVPAEPTSRPGDLYVLGRHRLLCGDATNADDVARLLDGAEPVLMATDPPFGVELDMEWRDRAGINTRGPAEPSYMRQGTEGRRNVSLSSDTIADWSHAYELVPSIQAAYVWHASAHVCEVLAGLRRIGFTSFQHVIWDKGTATRTRTHYWYQHEPCWYARKPNAPWYGAPGTASATVWQAPPPKFVFGDSDEERFDHPTQKPVALSVRPIENHLRPGEHVYEPFCGSGTTLIAAEQTGRVALAMEIEPRYVDVAVRRWEDFTGREAARQ